MPLACRLAAGYPSMMRLATQEDSTGGRPLPDRRGCIGHAATATGKGDAPRAQVDGEADAMRPTGGQGEGNNGIFLPLPGGLLKSARRALARPAGATERRASWRDVCVHQHVRSYTGTGESHGWENRY